MCFSTAVCCWQALSIDSTICIEQAGGHLDILWARSYFLLFIFHMAAHTGLHKLAPSIFAEPVMMPMIAGHIPRECLLSAAAVVVSDSHLCMRVQTGLYLRHSTGTWASWRLGWLVGWPCGCSAAEDGLTAHDLEARRARLASSAYGCQSLPRAV